MPMSDVDTYASRCIKCGEPTTDKDFNPVDVDGTPVNEYKVYHFYKGVLKRGWRLPIVGGSICLRFHKSCEQPIINEDLEYEQNLETEIVAAYNEIRALEKRLKGTPATKEDLKRADEQYGNVDE